MEEDSKVAIIATGVAGRGGVTVFAHAGCEVALHVGQAGVARRVELLLAPWTDPETVCAVRTLVEKVAQQPEEDGVAAIESIDRTVTSDPDLHRSCNGPYEPVGLNAPVRMAWRDRRLMALARHKRNVEEGAP